MSVESTLEYLRTLYRRDARPWVVAFSGGKDSMALLQLVWQALYHVDALHKPVHVIASDTLVENPSVSRHLRKTLETIQTAAERQKLPLKVHLVEPAVEERFWTNLIGKGYPSPTRWFRWCTTRMKIRPARRIIEDITRDSGSVILLLGTRRAESRSRAQRMEARQRTESGLNPHHEIPKALVATPIEAWSDEDVWEFLATNDPPPWGQSHRELFKLYRQANAGECPGVLDLNTPSCGGSRFGCWTCTVVKLDRSLEGFVQSGEAHLKPLLDFRNWLKAIREDRSRRQPTTRTGKVGQLGPFTPETRKEILERLLALEKEVEFQIITDEEIAAIQRWWRADFFDTDQAIKIAAYYGREVVMERLAPLNDEEERLLEETALSFELDPDFLRHLLDLTRTYSHITRHGARAEYKRELEKLIAQKIEQEERADPSVRLDGPPARLKAADDL